MMPEFDILETSPDTKALSGTAQDQMIDDLLQMLNPEQREAAESLEGPLLVLAGAGTGKTRVLTSRIARILLGNFAFPSQILAVTFTNKAAREMQERIAHLAPGYSNGLWLGTFHSIALRILRRHVACVGLRDNFTILGDDDQLRLLKRVLQELNIDEKRWPAKAFGALIQQFKDRALTPEKAADTDVSHFANGQLLRVYETYQQQLKTLNACDFGDLLMHCVTLFRQYEDILAEYQRKFRYILVDEYQDTNVAQYLWLRLLAMSHQNICCVGDDDQSIYGWRGAEVGNILRFEKDFEKAKVVRLERNYRSTADILAAASSVIANNKGRLGKTLWTEKKDSSKVTVVSLWDEKQEAHYIGNEIEALRQVHQCPLKDIAILVRTGAQTRPLEECFTSIGVAYKVIGGLRFYERMEIRDAIAYIRCVVQPDDDLAFERIVNVPKRGLGKSTLDDIRTRASAQGIPMIKAAEIMLASSECKPKVRSVLSTLLGDFSRWRSRIADQPHVELVGTILEESGYMAMWKSEKTLEAEGRVENLKELLNALAEFSSLAEFLEHISLVMDTDTIDDNNMVRIMTLHAAKGLEFPIVFLPGWEEGLFPHQRRIDEEGTTGIEEERRLAYVGMTRAKERLTISFAANRRIFNQWQSAVPSRFVDELPAQHIQVINMGTGYGAVPPRAQQTSQGFQQSSWTGKGGGFGSFRTTPARKTAPAAGSTFSDTTETAGDKNGGFAKGGRIFHQKYGYGRITAVEGNNLTIAFEKSSVKTILKDYVTKV